MPFSSTMSGMLPPQNGVSPHVTGNYGESRANGPHGGTDFNYEGGQSGLNLTHPTIYSPIDGTVTFVGGDYGTIKIRDSQGNSHEILHTDTQNVRVGDQISAGDPIGTMGGRGPKGADQYPEHVHYQIKDPKGKRINPQDWWDNGSDNSNDVMDSAKKKTNNASKIPSPIVLDLDGDGVETVGLNGGAYFDHEADGFAELTGWVGSDDGLLVRDLNGNGIIDSGHELFGSETLLNTGQKSSNGFEALKELDSNNDGKIDINDTAFNSLKIWKDSDGDGYSSDGELLTMTEAGVQSINVGYQSSSLIDENGNAHQQIGSFSTISGETRGVADVWFNVDRTFSMPLDLVDIPQDIDLLPNAKGFGKVYDLHQAMARDSSGSLKSVVTQFSQTNSVSERENLLQTIIYRWTGVEDIDPTSRAATMIYGNVIGDARKLEALEEFMGEEWYGVWCWGTKDPNPHGNAAPVLLQAYSELSELIYGQLAAGSFLKPLYEKINYTWNEDAQTVTGDLGLVALAITDAINSNRSSGKELLSEFVRTLKGTGAKQKMALRRLTTVKRDD